MKLLLLLLFLGFHSGSIAGNDFHVEQGTQFSSGIEQNKTAQHYEQDFAAILSTVFTYVKHSKNIPQYRQHNFAKDLFLAETVRTPLTYFDDTFFVARYSYCKPIGLLLIFPKHYFW